MNKLIAILLLIATISANTANAFTSHGTSSITRRTNAAPLGSAFEVPTLGSPSSTALNLKVKVDPEAKGGKNVKGNAKMAAYGGSVVFALLLPVAFLVWSAVGK
jgi:hypothetical protein